MRSCLHLAVILRNYSAFSSSRELKKYCLLLPLPAAATAAAALATDGGKKLIEFTLAKGKNVDKVVKLQHSAHCTQQRQLRRGWRAKLSSFIGKIA